MSNRSALLFFYRNSAKESKHDIVQSQKVFDALNDHWIRKLSIEHLDLICYDETIQKGKDFGTRYFNALKDTFDLGYQKVISIGNDTPQLSLEQILKADKLTQKGKMCIGPSYDGGFYLWALHRDDLQYVDFKAINWQTSQVFYQLRNQLKQNGIENYQLKRLIDIDDIRSLRKVYHQLSGQHPLKEILSTGFTFSSDLNLFINTAYFDHHYSSYFFNKGPPELFIASE